MKRLALPAWLLAGVLAWSWGLASRSAPPPPPQATPPPPTSSTRPNSPDAAPRFDRLELTDLWNIANWQDRIPWQPFRPGVEVHRLYGNGTTGPTAVLLRYRDAAKVPLHAHDGYEHILVLAGSQRDQNGPLRAGTLAIHPPGTAHSVVSDAGCIVLAIYEKPVRFLDPDPKP